MRYSLLASVLVFAGSAGALSAAWAAESAARVPSQPKNTVRLTHLVLEELKQSNPRHYAQAQKILADAAELCRPGAPQVLKVEGRPAVSCSGAFLKTSNPPKREISFVLGDTRYLALVTMKDAAPTFHPAGQDEPAAVKPAK